MFDRLVNRVLAVATASWRNWTMAMEGHSTVSSCGLKGMTVGHQTTNLFSVHSSSLLRVLLRIS